MVKLEHENFNRQQNICVRSRSRAFVQATAVVVGLRQLEIHKEASMKEREGVHPLYFESKTGDKMLQA